MLATVPFTWHIPRRGQASSNELRVTSDASARYVRVPVAIESLQRLAMDAVYTFVAAVRDVPSVEQVRARFAGTYLHLITYASQSTESQRRQIYAAELDLARRYPDLQFEFDLLDRRGYPVQDQDEPGKWVERIRRLPDLTDEVQ